MYVWDYLEYIMYVNESKQHSGVSCGGWHTPLIPALRTLRREDDNFEVSMVCVAKQPHCKLRLTD